MKGKGRLRVEETFALTSRSGYHRSDNSTTIAVILVKLVNSGTEIAGIGVLGPIAGSVGEAEAGAPKRAGIGRLIYLCNLVGGYVGAAKYMVGRIWSSRCDQAFEPWKLLWHMGREMGFCGILGFGLREIWQKWRPK